MPAQLVWLVVILGLVVLGACALMPREIGKEDEPIVGLQLDLPSIEHMAGRVRDVRLPFSRGSQAPRVTASRPAVADGGEPPPPMGAPQPVLSQDPPPSFALPS